MVSYFNVVNDQMLFTGNYMEAYIPESYIKKNLCEFLGDDKIRLFGLFTFRLGGNNGVITPNSRLNTFNFPSMIITKPSGTEYREMELKQGVKEKFLVLKYFKNDAIKFTTKVISQIDNIEIFVNLLIEGNLPHILKYDDVKDITFKCLDINGGLKIPAETWSIVIATLYRYNKDLSIPFRKVRGLDKAGPLEYKTANARTISANDSTFSALIFEDIDTMLVNSINRKRENKNSNISPLETLIN